MRALVLGCVLAGAGCVSTPHELKVELRAHVDGETRETASFRVRTDRLRKAGISVDVARAYVQGFLDGIGELIGEAVLAALGREIAPPRPSPNPSWVRTVFPEGIPLEIVTVKGAEPPKVEKLVLPIAP